MRCLRLLRSVSPCSVHWIISFIKERVNPLTLSNDHISFPVCPKSRKLLQDTFSEDRSVGLEAASFCEEGMKTYCFPCRVRSPDSAVHSRCRWWWWPRVHVFRASRCFEEDILQPSLCHSLRYHVCLPMHFFALFPIATPPTLMQSITPFPPLTSPGEEALPVLDIRLQTLIAITCSACELTHNSHSACSLFGSWSERKKEKLRAIMHYFKVTTDESELMANLLLLLCDVYSRWRSVTWFLRRH